MTDLAQGASAEADEVTDGRRLRAIRNRDRVVDALLDLFVEGMTTPDVRLVAERAGLSVRSVFRYFDDLQELTLAAIVRHRERIEPLLEPPSLQGSLEERIEGFIERRLETYDAVRPIVLVARSRMEEFPQIADALRNRRAILREHIPAVFAPELEQHPAAERDELLDALEAAVDFDTHELLRYERGLSREQAKRVMGRILRALLHECPVR